MKAIRILGLCIWMVLDALGASREAEWKQVDEAVNQGLPRTAIERLAPIIEGAMNDRAHGEAAKAIARRIVLEAEIEGGKPEERISRMEVEIPRAPAEMVPLLDTILAHWYWQYFQQNRWRFIQRTQSSQPPGSDLKTWDLRQILAGIDRQFSKALSAEAYLKTTPVATFGDLLEAGTYPDRYRPTLYDFIAHETLAFYTSAEQAGAESEDEFHLPTEDILPGAPTPFADASIFIAAVPDESALSVDQLRLLAAMRDSPAGRAYFLFQKLLKFHENDEDKTALLDADLTRLVWAWNAASGDGKADRYKDALRRFVDRWADHEVSAMALYQWARLLEQEEDPRGARELALRAVNSHRESPGARLCQNLVLKIESPSLEITTERIWNAPWPDIRVNYRNMTNVHFRAVPWDWEGFLSNGSGRPGVITDVDRSRILATPAALEWSSGLTPTEDFKERATDLQAPGSLKAGYYCLLASASPGFDPKQQPVSIAEIWVSDLALVIHSRPGSLEGFVLEAESGEPVSGAEVAAWHQDPRTGLVPVTPVLTDANGLFAIAGVRDRNCFLRVRHNGQELGTRHPYWTSGERAVRAENQTIFFTDRSLYRPGQTIQYKGICAKVDDANNNYTPLDGTLLTVIFSDANGEVIARADHRCNDYGSFSGSFTAPANRLTGTMRIHASTGPQGETRFNVEEYKRPKFQVTLDAPRTQARLNDTVQLQGNAESYTGSPVDGASVKWRVVRQVRWPDWWGWRESWPRRGISASQEIAHGTAETGTDGKFTIEFIARPDPRVAESDEASFQFSIHAEATDSAGETRTAQREVNVGFTSLKATVSADAWQTTDAPVEFRITTTTLDEEPQVAEGTLKLHRLKEPDRVHRPFMGEISSYRPGPTTDKPDLSDPVWWEPDGQVLEQGFTSGTNGLVKMPVNLDRGVYRATLETQDQFGRKVTARVQVRVVKPGEPNLGIRIPNLVESPAWSVEPGEEFSALWGTGYETGRAFVEIEHRNRRIRGFWTEPGRTQQQIRQEVTEAMRGGFTLHLTQIRENRAYLETRRVEVPWSNKELEITWEHITSRLEPGQKETWTAVVRKGGSGKADAKKEAGLIEMVAALYDQSLDQFLPHHWPARFNFFHQDHSWGRRVFENVISRFQQVWSPWETPVSAVELSYRHFPHDLVMPTHWIDFLKSGRGVFDARAYSMPTAAREGLAVAAAEMAPVMARRGGLLAEADVSGAGGGQSAPLPPPDLQKLQPRANLNETAFFFPHLTADTNGTVRMTFVMPEALTTWRFLGFAHDKDLRSGLLNGTTVTSRELMVQPNPPRFVREGDVLEFPVKVTNQGTNRLSGRVQLTFANAETGASEDARLSVQPVGNRTDGSASAPPPNVAGDSATGIPFDIPAGESRSYAWRIRVPDGAPFLTYKAVGSTGRVADGEEGYLPVLSRYTLVTESLPLAIRGPGVKEYEFGKLIESGGSSTLRHQRLTVEMVSNPAWYAVLALPYLMEYPYECTEQTFNRLYANSLARHIAARDPKIRRVFDQWRATPALDSPLEKREDLKSVLIEETPWVREARSESEARRNVGILFDDNRLNSETARLLAKLAEAQLPDGMWPWFPGGRGNEFMTLYIVTGFGRLRHLGVDLPIDLARNALGGLDEWIQERYRDIQKSSNPGDHVPGATEALYLYGRSFFLKDLPIPAEQRKAVEFFLSQARSKWARVADRQTQAHLALGLKRFGDDSDPVPAAILRSLKERSVTNDELGMFWRDMEENWWWYRAPIETQALMVEAFDEILSDQAAVEACGVWLLMQKRTQNWRTTKATADAVYALLLRGRDLLAGDALTKVSVGGVDLTPDRNRAAGSGIEPGTGAYERRFSGSEIKPELGKIRVEKPGDGVSWGGVHWQYLEDIGKITPHDGTPLSLVKRLFVRIHSKDGPKLEPVSGPLKVGDELVVRIELRTDRDMEYLHLKDQRGSGSEPVNVLSGYRYQDGLSYYESTRDTASHFFIDYLPRGTYVFEYAVRIQHRGEYPCGMAEIQCLYAPEFGSHSQGYSLSVR